MKDFVMCDHCYCKEPHTKIYQCSNCKLFFCDECKEPINKCPHCGTEAGTFEIKGEIK